ncbi:MAG: ABC transporter ATP-binding protein [Sumerlaeia bacterium]
MITLEGVKKAFGPKRIYHDLNLDVREGETHSVIGRSGEGKSVLLKIVSGLLCADAGVVTVDGHRLDPHDRKSLEFVRQQVTMVFQMGALFDSMTVRENVGFYLDQHKLKPKKEIDELCEMLLQEVRLPDTGHLLPSELSGGMRKRVGLARALAAEPRIVLYDEPTTGLDPVTTDVIGDLIEQTSRKHNVTSIVVTHDMQSAYKISDRISMLYEGEIIFTGTPQEIQESTNPIIVQFINGEAKGPITHHEQEVISQLSNDLIRKSLLIRKIHLHDDRP